MFAGRPIIGIAGGIGAGKSHVARLLERAGCCRIASDEMVRAAYTHPAVKRAVVERFGERVLDEGGRIDRKVIADIVFRNAAERQWLEALLHPVANQARVELMDQASRDPQVLAYVWDSPLLLEAKLNELCDTVVFVDAPRSDRLGRVAERGWDDAELDRREKVQMPLDKKRAMADYQMCNAESDPATPEKVAALLEEILDRFTGNTHPEKPSNACPAAGCCAGGAVTPTTSSGGQCPDCGQADSPVVSQASAASPCSCDASSSGPAAD